MNNPRFVKLNSTQVARLEHVASKKAKLGRPFMPPAEVASERLSCRITAGRLLAYHAAAERAGKTLTAWVFSKLDRAAQVHDPKE